MRLSRLFEAARKDGVQVRRTDKLERPSVEYLRGGMWRAGGYIEDIIADQYDQVAGVIADLMLQESEDYLGGENE